MLDQFRLVYYIISFGITLADGRKMEVHFEATEQGCKVLEHFEPESENSREMQEMVWQAILNHFKTYTEQSN